ncbi:hypothetical protein BU631_02430 [Staphylococcus caprae]|nr:hypothetical protein BU631_02430 [Staphylococcus caprae]
MSIILVLYDYIINDTVLNYHFQIFSKKRVFTLTSDKPQTANKGLMLQVISREILLLNNMINYS